MYFGAYDLIYLISSSVFLTSFLNINDDDSGTKIKGIRHSSIAKPITDTLGNPLLMENALRNGATTEPNCERPYIEPAPIDWISRGNDSVWIITIMK